MHLSPEWFEILGFPDLKYLVISDFTDRGTCMENFITIKPNLRRIINNHVTFVHPSKPGTFSVPGPGNPQRNAPHDMIF